MATVLSAGLAGYAGLRQLLYADASVLALVGSKIYQERAPNGVEMPYAVIRHYTGGEDNDAQSRAADMMFRVYIVTDDVTIAAKYQALVSNALHRKTPDFTAVNADAANDMAIKAYTWVTEEYVDVVPYPIQQRTVYEAGGVYRIRLSIIEV